MPNPTINLATARHVLQLQTLATTGMATKRGSRHDEAEAKIEDLARLHGTEPADLVKQAEEVVRQDRLPRQFRVEHP